MLDFWISALVLASIAAAFLLLPLRRPPGQGCDTRARVNVRLYHERLALLDAEREAGRLSQADWESAQAEMARALLAEAHTEPHPRQPGVRTGRWAIWGVALAVPLVAFGLYLHFGALERLGLSRELATPAASPAEQLTRLERVVQVQPDAPDGLYLLARTYMNQNRAAEAVPLFARAAELAGRPPELLGQWAQAMYFAAGRQWSGQIQALVDEALQRNPAEGTSLGLLGIAAFEGKHWAAAIGYWQRLQASLGPADPARAALQTGIDRARAELLTAGGKEASASGVDVQVALAPTVATRVAPNDTVFVFARAASGPPIPLAVRRLRAADLPARLTLSDADAMQPGLKLSSFRDVQVMARVSRSGQATQGEWSGVGAPVPGAPNAYTLIIDTAEP
ncbi:c-type cytochrome biogenesis protein CcmI [Pseudomonas massiliensis]|uniref:c-type cytochrome biogenesis protein CcmI n=1 Tax=Pseudomonas massiliensis TaxID=522492 RepID=UPI000590446D|nr:c-type cytochrome biogenesis protein CcmI [Pseudomonas massiliensis]